MFSWFPSLISYGLLEPFNHICITDRWSKRYIMSTLLHNKTFSGEEQDTDPPSCHYRIYILVCKVLAVTKMISRLWIGHRRITHSYLLEGKQLMCYACQTKYTIKQILIKCTDQAHMRKSFYSANIMKELLQNTEINNVISFLKTEVIHKNLKKIAIRQITSINSFVTRYILTNWSLP